MAMDREDFLRAFHAAHPAVTARAMAHGRAGDGRSSYDILRDRVAACGRVLDLGCGDGLLLELLAAGEAGARRRLAGIDLSAEELALARRRPGVERADLRVGRAQQLPFRASHFDGCVSHMALMLMSEAEQVAAELARVLEPGGTLAVVVGGGPAGGEAYERFVRLAKPLFKAAPPERRTPPLGDRRLRSHEGFDEVFGAAGFGRVEWRPYGSTCPGRPNGSGAPSAPSTTSDRSTPRSPRIYGPASRRSRRWQRCRTAAFRAR